MTLLALQAKKTDPHPRTRTVSESGEKAQTPVNILSAFWLQRERGREDRGGGEKEERFRREFDAVCLVARFFCVAPPWGREKGGVKRKRGSEWEGGGKPVKGEQSSLSTHIGYRPPSSRAPPGDLTHLANASPVATSHTVSASYAPESRSLPSGEKETLRTSALPSSVRVGARGAASSRTPGAPPPQKQQPILRSLLFPAAKWEMPTGGRGSYVNSIRWGGLAAWTVDREGPVHARASRNGGGDGPVMTRNQNKEVPGCLAPKALRRAFLSSEGKGGGGGEMRQGSQSGERGSFASM